MATSVPVRVGRLKRGLWKLGTQPVRWFTLVGDRIVVAAGLTLAFAVFVAAIAAAGVVATLESRRLVYLFQGIAAANVTLVTIVVSVNQLVLSRELNAPGELRGRIDNVTEYRETVEETTHRSPVPITPSKFLAVLLDGTRETAQQLGGVVEELDEGRHTAAVKAFVDDLTEDMDQNRAQLERSQMGIFSALASMLETDFSRHLHEAYRLKTVYEDELPSEAHDLLDEECRSLYQLDIARQYFRSIYFQSELAQFSRSLLYVGLPAVGSALLFLFVYTAAAAPPIPVAILGYLVPAAVVVGFTPFAVLFSYILRIAMVAQQTVAITPFSTPDKGTILDDSRTQ